MFFGLFLVAPGAVGPVSVRLLRVADAAVVLTISTSLTTPSYETASAVGVLGSAYYVQVSTTDNADVAEIFYAGAVMEFA